MTRTEKIEVLAKQEYDERENQESFKAGVLAGIRLRDKELLNKVGKLNIDELKLRYPSAFNSLTQADSEMDYQRHCSAVEAARWQHEQILLKIKGIE